MHMKLVIVVIVLMYNSQVMVNGAAVPVISKAVVCERSRKTLTCPEGQVLDIVKGFYGRTDTTICPRGIHHKTDCVSCGSDGVIKEACNDKQSCRLVASSTVFGDPCKGFSKYISVEYTCK